MTNLWRDLPPGPNPPKCIYTIVEVPNGVSNKYEYDIELGVFRLDRVLYSALYFPGDYGIIPQSWYEDDDPLDVLVLTTKPTFTGCILEARPIGILTMEDEKGEDDKIIAVPTHDPRFDEVKDISSMAQHLLAEIADFFVSYKKLEPHKWVKVKKWKDSPAAEQIILTAIKMFQERFKK
ncbi:MAG: inorganic diphosphatase [Promethearchaeota archaeon]